MRSFARWIFVDGWGYSPGVLAAFWIAVFALVFSLAVMIALA